MNKTIFSRSPFMHTKDGQTLIPVMEMEPKWKTDELRRRMEAHDPLSRPCLRFNWGYWDGANLTARGMSRRDGIDADNIVANHFDPFYAHGFVAGCAVVKGQGMDGRSSARAWTEFQAGLTDSNLLFQIEVNP